MQQEVSATQTWPVTLGAYRLERPLVEGKSWLARTAGGRRVVLKALPEDCLAGRNLHGDIRDRLERVRELAHVGVANLYGVERDGSLAFSVWEYVEGRSLEQHLQYPHGMAIRRVAHELVSGVQSLHLLGLRHGALHERNVIITPTGAVRLTHLSPLLYLDSDVDVQGLLEVLPLLGCREEIADLDCNAPLRELSLRVLAWSKESRSAGPRPPRDEHPPRWNQRKTALLGAALAAAAAIAVAGYAAWHAGWGSSAPEPQPAAGSAEPARPPVAPAEPSTAIDDPPDFVAQASRLIPIHISKIAGKDGSASEASVLAGHEHQTVDVSGRPARTLAPLQSARSQEVYMGEASRLWCGYPGTSPTPESIVMPGGCP